jgi:hypothetical protein
MTRIRISHSWRTIRGAQIRIVHRRRLAVKSDPSTLRFARLSDIEPQFASNACGNRDAILRGGSDPVMMNGRSRETAAAQP